MADDKNLICSIKPMKQDIGIYKHINEICEQLNIPCLEFDKVNANNMIYPSISFEKIEEFEDQFINKFWGPGPYAIRQEPLETLFFDDKKGDLTMPKINKVIFNDPATIIQWADGTKTVVKATNENFDPEKGLAMAIAKKALGNEGSYFNEFKKWLPKTEDKPDFTLGCRVIVNNHKSKLFGLVGNIDRFYGKDTAYVYDENTVFHRIKLSSLSLYDY